MSVLAVTLNHIVGLPDQNRQVISSGDAFIATAEVNTHKGTNTPRKFGSVLPTW